jgi:hypothetical protein
MGKHQYLALWIAADDSQRWSGPHDTIAAAYAMVPSDAKASVITLPLPAMTPSEKREALPILQSNQNV